MDLWQAVVLRQQFVSIGYRQHLKAVEAEAIFGGRYALNMDRKRGD